MADNPLSTQMQALITYANETTGESDADLSAAVGHLVDGFGGGDSLHFFGDKFELFCETEYELTETITSTTTATVYLSYDSTLAPDDYPYFFVSQSILIEDNEDDTSYNRPLITTTFGANRAKSNFYCITFSNPIVLLSNGTVVNGNSSVVGMCAGNMSNSGIWLLTYRQTGSGTSQINPVKGKYKIRVYKSKRPVSEFLND